MKPAIRTGSFVGTGGYVNVEIGYVPTYVKVTQGSGTVAPCEAWLTWAVAFNSGGMASAGVPYNPIVPGSTIRGVTSKATATVKEVQMASGAFSTSPIGNAVGVLILDENTITGTFTAENIVVTNAANGVVGADDATITAPAVTCVTGAAVVTGAAGIQRYEGTAAGASKGFTVGGTVAPAGVHCRFTALRENT